MIRLDCFFKLDMKLTFSCGLQKNPLFFKEIWREMRTRGWIPLFFSAFCSISDKADRVPPVLQLQEGAPNSRLLDRDASQGCRQSGKLEKSGKVKKFVTAEKSLVISDTSTNHWSSYCLPSLVIFKASHLSISYWMPFPYNKKILPETKQKLAYSKKVKEGNFVWRSRNS